MTRLLLLVASVLALSGCAVTVTPAPVSASIRVSSLRVVRYARECKDGGWRELSRRDGSAFANQGACVSYVRAGR